MKPTTLTMWLARDKDDGSVGLFAEEPTKTCNPMIGDCFISTKRSTRLAQKFGLRPGQCKKVKVTIEEVEFGNNADICTTGIDGATSKMGKTSI